MLVYKYTSEVMSFYITLLKLYVLVYKIFYENLKLCGVSAATGQGIDDLYTLVEECRVEYET